MDFRPQPIGSSLAAELPTHALARCPTTAPLVLTAPSEPSHVTISSMDGGYKATRGLEMLFHEASHTIADSLGAALRDISAQTGKAPPFGVLHAIIFFTAGELTRRAVVGYTPFAEVAGLWRTGRIARYLPVIQGHWVAHLDGRSSLREAMRAIIADL